MTLVASTSVATALLALKIAFIVLLYLFVLRVIRSAGRADTKASPSQDSMILTPGAAASAGLGRSSAARPSARLVVQRSPSLEEGGEFALNAAPVTVGRGGQNDLVLTGDEFASARHARIELRGDGVWVQDLESTNGTFVNGTRVAGAQRLGDGDVVRVGATDLMVEED